MTEVSTQPLAMLRALLQEQHRAGFDELPGLVRSAARSAGLDDAAIYLVDVQQHWLVPMERGGAAELEQARQVEGSLAGRAFRDNTILEAPSRGEASDMWLPLLNGGERLGVLSLRAGSKGIDLHLADEIASLVALLVANKRAHSDSFEHATRTRDMSLSAEVQWTLLSASTFATDAVVVSGALEPAYAVGGDAFDYSLNDHTLNLAIFDAMGHDLSAGLAATIAVQDWRNLRRSRAKLDLVEVTSHISETLAEQFALERYVTGLVAQLDTSTGQLTWTSRGHPGPLLIRDGRWIKTLDCTPGTPMGLRLDDGMHVCSEQLEQGDRLVFFTDGVVEARDSAGVTFGVDTFVDFLVRRHADGLHAPETLRQLVHTILTHHGDRLSDDATIMLVEWRGRSKRRDNLRS